MTYVLSATKQQNGWASVTGRFSYEENIFYPGHELLQAYEPEWKKQAGNITERRNARQRNVRDAIKSFLESRYGAKGLKSYDILGPDNLVLTNHDSKQKRGYHATSNETTYDVCVSGQLRKGEHLEDMLDCEALNKELEAVFQEHERLAKEAKK
jgi:hypothetical protein